MKRLVASLVLFSSLFLLTPFSADALVGVRGYYRSNGTYVAPHYRTSPDGYAGNNFSTNGIHTTGMSRATAQYYENSLNSGYSSYSSYTYSPHLSSREKKVVACQHQGHTEAYCKSIHIFELLIQLIHLEL